MKHQEGVIKIVQSENASQKSCVGAGTVDGPALQPALDIGARFQVKRQERLMNGGQPTVDDPRNYVVTGHQKSIQLQCPRLLLPEMDKDMVHLPDRQVNGRKKCHHDLHQNARHGSHKR